MHRIARVLGLPLAVALLWPPAADARTARGGASAIAQKNTDLGELRERIEQMKREMAAGESSRAEAADQLRDSEQAISDLQRELHQLAEQREDLQATLQELGGEAGALETELDAQQRRLERLFARQYANRTPDTLRLLLSGRDPNQVARDLHYLRLVAQARSALLKEIEALLARKRTLATATRERAQALAAIEADQRRRHAEVARERDARKKLINRLAAKISAQRKEIGALQRNEQRLSRLIERLARLAASRPARKSAPADEPRNNKREPAVENRETPAPGLAGAFSRLRGSLRLPVSGQVSGRFGASREGGGTWKGVFIRAASGAEVKAIAPGQVVFAEWMRGFGNLLILDHGDGYLSIYGFNEALLRALGDEVRSGDAIASVGNSGGHPESGLYFEIRHQGQAQDPLKWARAR